MVKPSAFSARMVRADLLDDDRRQPLGRLVEQQQPRAGAQDAADRQHLLLAARELGALAAPSRSLRFGKQLEDALERQPARPHLRRQQQVLLDVEAREDAALLRAEGDAERARSGSTAVPISLAALEARPSRAAGRRCP